MLKVIFVCLGNICRSPMAEAAFCRLAEERGVADKFKVTSRGTSGCEAGNPVYPPAMHVLRERGYNFTHFARQLTAGEVADADYVLVMDAMNLSDVLSLTGGAYAEKVFLLGHFSKEKIYVDDPWYTRDFNRAYSEIYSSCSAFLNYLIKEGKL